jgi:hypothetical protein
MEINLLEKSRFLCRGSAKRFSELEVWSWELSGSQGQPKMSNKFAARLKMDYSST